MDFSWLNGMAPFMIAAGVQSDRKVNSTRLVEAVIIAIVVAAISTAAGAFVTLRIVEWQTSQLVKTDDERGRQIVGLLTQMASVQSQQTSTQVQLTNISQTQAAFGREMHERLMAVERRVAGEVERYPRARP